MSAAERDQTRNTAQTGSHLRAVSPDPSASADRYNFAPPNKYQMVKSRYRCALIGDELQPDAVLYVVRVPVQVTGYNYRDPYPNVVAAPQALNVHPFHGGTEGVGLAFSALMQRYLSAVIRDLGAQSRRELSEWWESDYGIARVRAGLQSLYSPQRAKAILNMVLECAREDADPVEVAIENNQTVAWLAKVIARCQWLADKPASAKMYRRERI